MKTKTIFKIQKKYILKVALLPVFVFTLLLASIYLTSSPDSLVQAAVNDELNYQARLLKPAGDLVLDGDYSLEFKLYNASTSSGSSQGSCAGDTNCLWTETYTGGNVVRVVNGYITVNLGSITTFPSTIDWSQELWLTLNVGGIGGPTWDGEMTPRTRVTAVPYAFSSGAATKLSKTDSGFTTTLEVTTPTANNTLTLPDVTGTVCISTGNCVGTGGAGSAIGGSGTLNTIALFTPDGNNIGNSILTQTGGTTISVGGALAVTGASDLVGATTLGDNTTAGSLLISDGSSNYATIGLNALASDYTINIPTITANDTFCLFVLSNCAGGGGVSSLNTFTGALSVLGTANEIEVSNSTPNITIGLPDDVTITDTLTVTNATTASEFIFSNDSETASRRYYESRTLPTTAGDYVEIGNFSLVNTGINLNAQITVSSSGNSVAKSYAIPINYIAANSDYYDVLPLSSSGAYSGNDFALEVNVTGSVATLRIRRTAGAVAGTAVINIEQQGSVSTNFTSTSGTGTSVASSGIYDSTPLTQVDGKVGIGTASPSQKLDVAGTVGFENAIYVSDGTNGQQVALDSYGTYNFGYNVALGAGGSTVVGSGESASLIIANVAEDESLKLSSDTSTIFYNNLNTGWGAVTRPLILESSGNVVINEDSDVTDFRVEGGTAANLLFVDGSTDRVGIGTASPNGLFQVGEDATSPQTGVVQFFGDPASTDLVSDEIITLGRPFNGGTSFGNYASLNLGSYTAGSNRNARLDFNLSDSGDTPDVTVLSLLGNGNVGIGTASPDVELHVKGDTNSTLVIEAVGAADSRIWFADAFSNNPGVIEYDHNLNNLIFGTTDGTADVMLGNTGNLGIGTTTFDDRLEVSGGNLDIDTGALELNDVVRISNAGAFTGNGAALTNLDADNINAGTLTVANGGTGATSFTAGGILYGNGAGVLGVSAVGTSGQCLVSGGAGAPTWTNCAGSGGAGGIGGSGTLNTIPLFTPDGYSIGDSILTQSGTIVTATGSLSVVGSLGTISTSSTGNNFNFSRAGANYITSTNAAGALNFGTNDDQSVITIQADEDVNIDNNTLFVDASTDRVGIGTTSPSQTLDVAGSINISNNSSFQVRNAADSGNISILTLGASDDVTVGATAADNLYLRSGTSENIIFQNGGTELARFDAGGELGIGTTAPGRALDIVAANAQQLRIRSTEADATLKNAYIQVGHYTNAEEDVLSILSQSLATNNNIKIGGGSGSLNAATQIDLYTAANNTTLTGTSRLAINSSGQVTLSNLGTGVVQASAAGLLSSSALNISGSLVTGTLAVGNGGTGATTFTAGGVLYGNGASALAASAAGTSGQCLVSGGAGAPTWGACSAGGVTGSGTADTIALFTATGSVIGDSILTQSGSTVNVAGVLSVNSGADLTYTGALGLLRLSNTTNGNGGFQFGSAGDTNLYRSATNTLKTDDNFEVTADLAVNGGDLTTNQTTFNLLNTTATTLNVGGAATTLSLGAATGTTTVNNSLTVAGNAFVDADIAGTVALRVQAAAGQSVNVLEIEDSAGTTDYLTVSSAGNVGVGVTTALHRLHVEDAATDAASRVTNYSNTAVTATADGAYYTVGSLVNVTQSVDNTFTNSGFITGVETNAFATGAGDLTQAQGMYLSAGTDASHTGTLANSYGIAARTLLQGTGDITTGYGIYASVDDIGGGTIGTGYGLFIAGVNATTDYGIYQSGADDANYFAGTLKVDGKAAFGAANIDDTTIINASESYSSGLIVERNVTSVSTDNVAGITNYLKLTPTSSATSAYINGADNRLLVDTSNTQNFSRLSGSYNEVSYGSSGTATYLYGGYNRVVKDGTGAVTEASGTLIEVSNENGNTSELNGAEIFASNWSSGASQTIKGIDVVANNRNSNAVNLSGISSTAELDSTGTASNIHGGKFGIANYGTGSATNGYGIKVESASKFSSGGYTGNAGIAIAAQTVGTNNTGLLIGTTTIPTGNFGVYNSSTYDNYIAGNLLLGTTSGTAKLNVARTITNDSNESIRATLDSTTNSNGDYVSIGILGAADENVTSGVTNSGHLIGVAGEAFMVGAGTLDNSIGVEGYTGIDTGATAASVLADAKGVRGAVENFTAGTITQAFGLYSAVYNSGAGSITTGYGLYINNVEASNEYGIYQESSTDRNYFSGSIGIGDSSPTGKLQVTGDEVRIGAGGTVDIASGDGDLYVQDALEVDGVIRFANLNCTSYTNGGTITADANGTLSCQNDDGGAGAATFTTTSNVAHLLTAGDSVSIGSSSANGKLFVDGDTIGEVTFRVQGAASQTANYLEVERSSGSNYLIVDSSGNVGINEDAPDALLHVRESGSDYVASVSGDTVALFQASNSASSFVGVSLVSGNTGSVDLNFGDTDDEDPGRIRYDNNDNTFKFRASGSSDDLFYNNTGLGIGGGASGISALLHVATSSSTLPTLDTSTDALIVDSDSGSSDAILSIIGGNGAAASSGSSRLYFGDSDNEDSGNIEYDHENDELFIEVNASQALLIDSSGNVGINNSSPGAKLDVTGTIRQSNATSCALDANSNGDIICTVSDERLKNINSSYSGGLAAIRNINPINFSYKNDTKNIAKSGFSAQNVVQFIPNAARLLDNGYYTLDPTAIIATSVNAIKQIDAALTNNVNKVLSVQTSVTSINNRLIAVEAAVASNVRSSLVVTGVTTLNGKLVVNKDVTINADLILKGKLVTAGEVPTLEADESVVGTEAVVTVEGNDTSGTITVVAGETTTAGQAVKVIFASPFKQIPRLVIGATNLNATQTNVYVDSSSITNEFFTVNIGEAMLEGESYVYTYFAVQ